MHNGAGMTDGELLDFFVRQHDDAALAALVRRHGPMVWGVCRRLLRSHHDAEDAFQATFLILVRKAATIQQKELIGNWLYGVAHQTAVKARAMAAKKNVREKQVAQMPEPAAAEQRREDDQKSLLDEELSRLPEKYRVLLVLCDLEGNTRKEVARQLGCPEGTVAGRLVRAREMLAKRLTRQGATLSGVALASILPANGASAAVPATLAKSTIQAATLLAAGNAATGRSDFRQRCCPYPGSDQSDVHGQNQNRRATFRGHPWHRRAGDGPAQRDAAIFVRAGRRSGSRRAADAKTPKATDVESMLKAKDFWAKIGKKTDHPDLAGKATEIKKLTEDAKEPLVRIRAYKLTTDMEGRTRADASYRAAQVEDAVAAPSRTWRPISKMPPFRNFARRSASRTSPCPKGPAMPTACGC